jgi:hypothetical protein
MLYVWKIVEALNDHTTNKEFQNGLVDLIFKKVINQTEKTYDQYIQIPKGVTTIKQNAFKDCEFMKYIIIPNTVTSIEESAFENCKNLTSITISENVTYIKKSAFAHCEKLTHITIPDDV